MYSTGPEYRYSTPTGNSLEMDNTQILNLVPTHSIPPGMWGCGGGRFRGFGSSGVWGCRIVGMQTMLLSNVSTLYLLLSIVT